MLQIEGFKQALLSYATLSVQDLGILEKIYCNPDH